MLSEQACEFIREDLAHRPDVAGHTDHRLFIADFGNARIVSVKLGYHASEKIALGK